MKPSLPFLIALPFASLLLSQCVMVEDPSQGGTSTPAANVSGSPMQTNQIYDLGLEKGFADGRGGLSRTPSRHDGAYASGESDAFNMGYDAGYNKGSRP